MYNNRGNYYNNGYRNNYYNNGYRNSYYNSGYDNTYLPGGRYTPYIGNYRGNYVQSHNIDNRMHNLERRLDSYVSSLDRKMDNRLWNLERSMDARIGSHGNRGFRMNGNYGYSNRNYYNGRSQTYQPLGFTSPYYRS